jgi:hypothetical protein
MPLPAKLFQSIGAWLGHASAAFTLSVYAHSQDEALKAGRDEFRSSCDIR